MRFIRVNDDGNYTLTDHLYGEDVPPYAILSHTWGKDGEEVTLQDLRYDTGLEKLGHHKISFCCKQLKRDGLRHVWIDSCCIDQLNSVELHEAINSMFRWYQNAVKCYALLTDVSCRDGTPGSTHINNSWKSEFQDSRWFTRGWTLQELLAPSAVEFFSNEGVKLGDKQSLESYICQSTSIPADALRGKELTSFSIAERLAWQEGRRTKREEDLAYSLLGICGVSLAVIYGEGKLNAFRRLRREIDDYSKDVQHDDFSVTFSLSDMTDLGRFVGREKELGEIHRELRSDGSRRTVIVHGLGGIGKSQLAISYAKRHKDFYSAIFWMQANSKESLAQSFAAAARRINREYRQKKRLDGSPEIDTNNPVDAVKGWLSLPANTRWLLIFDSHDNLLIPGKSDHTVVDIHEYLPESHQGAVIITSRSSDVHMGYRIRMEQLNKTESLEVLSYTSRRQKNIDDVAAIELVNLLNGLPLALATAGAYLYQTPITFKEYAELYDKSWKQLQLSSPYLTSYHGRSLLNTWEPSLERIRKLDPGSAQLLEMWTYFDSRDVWFELLQPYCESEIGFHGMMRVLCDHGMAKVNDGPTPDMQPPGYCIHPCVQLWMKSTKMTSIVGETALSVLKCVSRTAERCLHSEAWLSLGRLLKHGEACFRIIEQLDMPKNCDDPLGDPIETVRMLSNIASLLKQQGKWKKADAILDRARKFYPRMDEMVMWRAKHCHGDVLKMLCRFDEAYATLYAVLEEYEKVFGTGSENALKAMLSIIEAYLRQGNDSEAEKLMDRAWQSRADWDSVDPGLRYKLCSMHGAIHSIMGHLQLAEERSKEGYTKLKELKGPYYIETLRAWRILVNIIGKQQPNTLFQDARERVWKAYQHVLGENHFETLLAAAQLAELRQEPAEAKSLFNASLAGLNETLGPDQYEVLKVKAALGYFYNTQREFAKADACYQIALEGLTTHLGKDNKAVLRVRNMRASMYAQQGKLDAAEQIFKTSLAVYMDTLGPKNPRTLWVESQLRDLGRGRVGSSSLARRVPVPPQSTDPSRFRWFTRKLNFASR